MSKIALYPGTFDPITCGHIDLIDRALKIFDKVIVGVSFHTSKKPLLSFSQRLSLTKRVLKDRERVEVKGFKGLVVDFAREAGARVIIRGLRMVSDFEYEFQMALTNRKIAPDIEIIFLMPQEKYSYTSSTLIKEIFKLGAKVDCFLPTPVIKVLKKKLKP